MRAALALGAAVLWQMAAVATNDGAAEPKHLRYERAVAVSPDAAGQACAVLDAAVFAHAATESLNDMRLYATGADGTEVETPFALSVNETQRDEDEAAVVQNVGTRDGDVVFDLAMPARPYTEVVLDLDAKDFLATAVVSGSDGRGGKATELGSFVLFDLSGQHLSRSTTLPLQESTFAVLHVRLHVTDAPGSAKHELGAGIVRGASVPPSREAQTLYTTVAENSAVVQQGRESVALLRVPAHVPVERVSFGIEPKMEKNFLREVRVTARPEGVRDKAAVETVSGAISHVKLAENDGSGEVEIDSQNLSVEAVLGASLSSAAVVEVAVENGDDAPLPIQAVRLEMRQRKICFDAVAGMSYVLMYGDDALRAPVYDYGRLFVAAVKPGAAVLGAERVNPRFVAGVDARPYSERHPELLWIGLLAVIAVLGSVALRSAKRQRHRTR